MAKLAECQQLCLTHISSRYDRNAWRELVEEGKEIFPNTEIAEDFKEIHLPLK